MFVKYVKPPWRNGLACWTSNSKVVVVVVVVFSYLHQILFDALHHTQRSPLRLVVTGVNTLEFEQTVWSDVHEVLTILILT